MVVVMTFKVQFVINDGSDSIDGSWIAFHMGAKVHHMTFKVEKSINAILLFI
jgi:hypothetical protein